MVLLLENYELLGNSNKKENEGDNFLLIDSTGGPCSWYQYNCVHHSYSPPDKPKNYSCYFWSGNNFKRNLKLFLRKTECKELASSLKCKECYA